MLQQKSETVAAQLQLAMCFILLLRRHRHAGAVGDINSNYYIRKSFSGLSIAL